MGYLRSLNYEKIEKHYFEKELAEEKECYKVIIDELTHFKNELDLFINILKSDLKNYLKFRCDLIDNISPEFTSYINIENVNNLFKTENFFKIKDIIKNFVFKESFIEKYDSLKNIFELMFKRGKYIENEFIKDIFSKNITPINEKYFMKIENEKFIILEKSLDLNLKKYKFNNIFESQLNYGFERLKIKENKNIKKKLSLYTLSYYKNYNGFLEATQLNEIIIENLCDFSVKSIKTFDQYIDLFVLSENQNIINNRGNIFLYDNSFKSPKSKKVSDEIFNIKEFFKVDSNTFIYSSEITYKTIDIYIANIIDNNISIKHTINCGEELIYFSEKKKIIFSMDFRYIYLINFNFEII